MDVSELNRRLIALSPSEEAYREGRVYQWGNGPNDEPVVVDGRSMFRMGHDVFNVDEGLARQALGHDQTDVRSLPPLAGRFLIKRNSRFNPVPEHVHDYIEMSYVYEGSCTQMVNGRELTLGENQVLLLDTNCPHAIAAQGMNDVMLSIVISKEFLRDNLAASVAKDSMLSQFLLNTLNEETDHRRYVLFRSEGNHRVRLFFQELLCEYLDPSINADEIALRLFQLILCELVNVYEDDFTDREVAKRRQPVTPLIHYIEQNYLTCTQQSVADHFYISPNYVSQLLKQHTGMTYIQVVQAQKLGHAASLLRNSEEPVTEVAHASGYENMSFFYRKFKEHYGCAPAAYREQSRKQQQDAHEILTAAGE